MTASTLTIGDEDPARFEQLRANLVENFDPGSALEVALVDQVAAQFWRVARIPKFEAEIISARQSQLQRLYSDSDAEVDEESPAEPGLAWGLGDALIQDAAFGDALGKLTRYQTTQLNSLQKLLQMLQDAKLQREEASGCTIDGVAHRIENTTPPIGDGD